MWNPKFAILSFLVYFSPLLFSAPRQISPHLEAGFDLSTSYQMRLKRSKSKQQLQDLLMIIPSKQIQLRPQQVQQLQLPQSGMGMSSAQSQSKLSGDGSSASVSVHGSQVSALGCIYSCYLVTVCRLICFAAEQRKLTNGNETDADAGDENDAGCDRRLNEAHSPGDNRIAMTATATATATAVTGKDRSRSVSRERVLHNDQGGESGGCGEQHSRECGCDESNSGSSGTATAGSIDFLSNDKDAEAALLALKVMFNIIVYKSSLFLQAAHALFDCVCKRPH
jgi:hypothetical protein